LFAIPFCLRLRIYKDSGMWSNLTQAFYHEHLELFLGNACLGNRLHISGAHGVCKENCTRINGLSS
jgi:hypothetical protein